MSAVLPDGRPVLENISRTGPGRPRLLNAAVESLLTDWSHPGCSRRTAQNRYFALQAASLLFASTGGRLVPREPAFAWFLTRRGDLKVTVLSELGRIPDDDALLEVARVVAMAEMPSPDAVRRIRWFRVGVRAPAAQSLARALGAAIDAHLASYPAATTRDVVAVLDVVRRVVPLYGMSRDALQEAAEAAALAGIDYRVFLAPAESDDVLTLAELCQGSAEEAMR